MRSCQYTRKSFFITSDSLNGHRQLQRLSSTHYKPKYVSCANVNGSGKTWGRYLFRLIVMTSVHVVAAEGLITGVGTVEVAKVMIEKDPI